MRENRITSSAPALTAFVVAASLLVPHAAVAASGMDGGFGYTWRDNAGGAVRDTMTLFEMGYDEEVGPADELVVGPVDLNLSSDFPFYGALYSQIWISDNGWISFVDPGGDPMPAPGPIVDVSAGPVEMIAPFWSDLELRTGNLIRYGYTGPTLDAFRIQVAAWDKASDQPMGYDLLLFPDGRIKVQYAIALSDINESAASVGIESVAEADGIGIVSAGATVPDVDLVGGTVLEFFPPPVLPEFCATLPEVGCATTSGSTGGGTPPLFYYPECNPFRWAAEGAVHSFSLTEPNDVDITLTGAGELSLFLLNECSEQSCLEGAADTATPFTSISRTLSAGDYQVSIDGPTTAADGTYTLDVACSPVASPLTCGDVAAGTTVGAPSRFDSYPCAPMVDLSGPEAIYSIDVATRTNLSASVTSGGADLDVLVLRPEAGDLDPESCVAWGDDGTTAWDALPGQYLVVVDGVAGAEDSFDLTTDCFVGLDCSSPLGTVDFATGRVHEIAGDTTGGVDAVQRWACDEDVDYTGPEQVWEIVLDQPGQIAVLQTDGEPELDYFFVSACNEGACVGGGMTPCASGLDAGTHYLVVDSASGAEGPYELTLIYEETFNRWSVCEDPVDPETSLEDTSSNHWHFSDNAFCISDPMSKNYPDGCIFAMYVTVPCGTSFNLPFSDTEGGHVRVFDLFNGEYVELIARSPTWSAAGDDIMWQDEDCEAGSDPRWNEVVTNVSFSDDAGLCGIYRLEFINHSGNVWELFANCDGTDTPGFDIADSLCVALSSFQPRPNVSLVSATGDYDCPDVTVTYTIENNGCAKVQDFPVALQDSGSEVHLDVIPEIGAGETLVRSFTTSFPTEPTGRVTLAADPLEEVVQCSPVDACDPASRVILLELPGCAGSCNVVADAFADPAVRCEDDATTITVDASASSASLCGSGMLEYRLMDRATVVRDWQPEPVFSGLSPDVPVDYDVVVRCVGEADCEDTITVPVDVHLRPVMDESSVTARDVASCNVGVELNWAPATWRGRSGTGSYNIYRSLDPGCDPATMEQVIIGLTETTYTDFDLDGEETYYYVVEAEDGSPASSCVPQGPANRGAVTRVAVEGGTCTGVFDSLTARPELLPRVGTTLRLGGTNPIAGFRRYGPTFVSLFWELDASLDAGADEHVHVLRSESPMRASFTLAHEDAPRLTDETFRDLDADHPDAAAVHVFHYLVVAADACENVNPTDFFGGP